VTIYALKGVAEEETTLEEVFEYIWLFILCGIALLILLLAFPKISSFLPNLFLG